MIPISQRLFEVNDLCDTSTSTLYSEFIETLQKLSVAGFGERSNLILEAERIYNESVSFAVEISYNIGLTDNTL